MEKKCSKCNEVRRTSEFHTHKSGGSKGRYYSWCKECERKRTKIWKKNNPERMKILARNWAKKYPERRRILNKKWAKENPEKIRIATEKFVKENSKKIMLSNKKWAKENPEKISGYRKKYKMNNPEKIMAHAMIHRRIKNGSLSKPEKCEVCGISGNIEGHHGNYSKPLSVIWVCRKCHLNFHTERRTQCNGEAKR